MLSLIRSRLLTMNLTFAVFVAAQPLSWITGARAAETAEPASPPTTPGTPSPLPPLHAVRAALREFDRFLDHHPVLEDRLRLDSQLTTNREFLEKNPELGDFLRANPNVAEGLKFYSRYYLNRALLRQASEPLSLRELTPFKALFRQQPELEQALTENPELIRDPGFLQSHPLLHDCLLQHPALARVYLPQPTPPQTK